MSPWASSDDGLCGLFHFSVLTMFTVVSNSQWKPGLAIISIFAVLLLLFKSFTASSNFLFCFLKSVKVWDNIILCGWILGAWKHFPSQVYGGVILNKWSNWLWRRMFHSAIENTHANISYICFFHISATRKSKQITWLSKPENTFTDKFTKQPSVFLADADYIKMGKE